MLWGAPRHVGDTLATCEFGALGRPKTPKVGYWRFRRFWTLLENVFFKLERTLDDVKSWPGMLWGDPRKGGDTLATCKFCAPGRPKTPMVGYWRFRRFWTLLEKVFFKLERPLDDV